MVIGRLLDDYGMVMVWILDGSWIVIERPLDDHGMVMEWLLDGY